MKERAPAFQFFPRQFAADDVVMAMDLDTIGAHILLMCAAAASPEQYRLRCRVDAEGMPDQCRTDAAERAIRNRLRNPSDADWLRIKTQLLAGAWKVSADGRWWEQDGLRRTFQKQKEFSARQSERAQTGWQRKRAERVPDACRNDAGSVPETMPKVCSSSSSSSSSSTPIREGGSVPDFDGEQWVRKIQRAHPRFEQGHANEVAIIDAIQTIASEQGIPDPQAAEFLLERTKLYRDSTSDWPDKSKITGSTRWFREGQYSQDEAIWLKNGEPGPGQKKDGAVVPKVNPAERLRKELAGD